METFARRDPGLAALAALATGLAIAGLLAVWPSTLPPPATGQATRAPSPSGSAPGRASGAPSVSTPDAGQPLLARATPPLTLGQETQSFDLEPMGQTAEGWLRSDAEVGIAAFPTSVDRSLGIPFSTAGHWACRSIPGIADGPVRFFADLLLTRQPGGGSPAVSLGRSTESPMLIWSGGRLELADATDRAGPLLDARTWYRIALEVDLTTRTLTWELAALEPWSHLRRQTAEIDSDAMAGADGLCVSGPRGAAGAALYLDDVRLEPVEGR